MFRKVATCSDVAGWAYASHYWCSGHLLLVCAKQTIVCNLVSSPPPHDVRMDVDTAARRQKLWMWTRPPDVRSCGCGHGRPTSEAVNVDTAADVRSCGCGHGRPTSEAVDVDTAARRQKLWMWTRPPDVRSCECGHGCRRQKLWMWTRPPDVRSCGCGHDCRVSRWCPGG